MAPRLIDLPYELLVQIAGLFLGEGSDGNYENNNGFDEERDDIEAPITGRAVVLNLAQTCGFFYKTLSPHLFRRIVLRDTDKSRRGIEYLMGTDHVSAVRVLHFKNGALGKTQEEPNGFAEIVSWKAEAILSNLPRFLHLETIVLDFESLFNEAIGRSYRHEIIATMHLNRTADRGRTLKLEEQEDWTSTVMKTLTDLPVNEVLRLLRYQCPPHPVNSIAGSTHLAEWLLKVGKLELEIKGGSKDSGLPLGNGIRVPRHGNFHMPLLGRVYNDPFDLYFFDALANVTQLTVIGLATANNLQLPLLSHQLRKLKELELKCCYIQDNFMEFLIAHLLTLRHLTLRDCILDSPKAKPRFVWQQSRPEDEPPPSARRVRESWDEWFHKYASEKPFALQDISFTPSHVVGRLYGVETHSNEPHMTTGPVLDVATEDEPRELPTTERGENVDALVGRDQGHTEGPSSPPYVMEGWHELEEVMKHNREKFAMHGWTAY